MAISNQVPSKNRINKAGKFWARALRLYREDRENPELDEFRAHTTMGSQEADELIEFWRSTHARPLTLVAANLRYYTNEQLSATSPTQRLKKRTTIVDKLVREPTMALTNMADIGGCRVVVEDQEQAYSLLSRLQEQKRWNIERVRDYVAEPKSSGYRALHVIEKRHERLIEIQIRTEFQDIWANQVERDSRLRRTDFKSGQGAEIVHDYYRAVAEFFALKESDIEPDIEFMQQLRERQAAVSPYLSSEEAR